MLKFFRIPFASSGDKTAIPDAADANGNVSYTQGYGFDYQRQKTDPAVKNIERDKMNELFFDITTALAELQSFGVPDFITSALNGGTAYSYALNARVKYTDGKVYQSISAANTALPTDPTKWAEVLAPGVGVTPPQFDNNTSLATTGFVQRALGSMSGSSTKTAAATLGTADVGTSIQLTGTSYTVTLPASTDVPNGSAILLQCSASGTITVQRAGADNIYPATFTSITSFTMAGGDTALMVKQGNGVWSMALGTSVLPYAPQFGSSLAANGYQKLPSGVIIQWGLTASISAGSSVSVTFPIAFPNACLHAYATPATGVTSSTAATPAVSASPSTTGMTVYCWGSIGMTAHWLAIGY